MKLNQKSKMIYLLTDKLLQEKAAVIAGDDIKGGLSLNNGSIKTLLAEALMLEEKLNSYVDENNDEKSPLISDPASAFFNLVT